MKTFLLILRLIFFKNGYFHNIVQIHISYFSKASNLSLTDNYYKSTDTVTLVDDLKVDIYIDVHRDTGMTFIQLHTFNSQNPTKKVGKGHIENGTTNVRLYELMGDCKVK